MMHMNINGGKMTITDDNQTVVSSDVAKQIKNGCIAPDSASDKEKNESGFVPNITIKD